MQIGGQNAHAGRSGSCSVRSVHRFQHHSARAITEEHAGGAVLEIQNAREHLGADHQRPARGAGADQRIGHGERVDKARAHGLHIEGRRAMGDAQLALQDGRRGRKHHVGRGGGHDDEVDVLWAHTSGLHRSAGGLFGQVAAHHAVVNEVPCPDAGALDDPLVRRFNALLRQLRGQLGVAQAARGQVAAGACDSARAAGAGGVHGRGHSALAAAGAAAVTASLTAAEAATEAAAACATAAAMPASTRCSNWLRAASCARRRACSKA